MILRYRCRIICILNKLLRARHIQKANDEITSDEKETLEICSPVKMEVECAKLANENRYQILRMVFRRDLE